MVRKFRQGVRYAYTGLTIAWNEELNFRIEIGIAVLVMALGFFFDISLFEWMFVTVSIALVIVAETFNTALEALCDAFRPQHDPHIAKIKDLSAAAVLLASCGAGIIGLLIFIPHL
ncbi:MAG TPA: diacylglycerol kinase family protein [Candidatus Paceibacterota bacterium]|nr:diacylglycerol kinase family protein [Candidatus Paceibacterota bacterium]